MRSVSAPAHDVCDPGKRRVGEAVILDEGVKGAALAPMSEGDAWDVVRDGAGFFSNLENLSGRDVDKARVRVDEAANEPGARDAVDLGPLTRHPLRGCSGLLRYGPAACLPSSEPAFEIMNGVASLAQEPGNTLTQLAAIDAVDDNGAGEFDVGCPRGRRVRVAVHRAWDHAGRCGIGVIAPEHR